MLLEVALLTLLPAVVEVVAGALVVDVVAALGVEVVAGAVDELPLCTVVDPVAVAAEDETSATRPMVRAPAAAATP